MQRTGFRLLSVFLALVLLVNMLPMSIFATELQKVTDQPLETETVEQSVTPSETWIIQEIPEKRTEYSKEFLLSNGLHMAAVYTDAVHYETEDGWEEIDNTIKVNIDGTLSNTAGVWDVTFPHDLAGDESITIEKDGYTLSFFMAGELQNTNLEIMSTVPQTMETIPAATTAEEMPETKVTAGKEDIAHITVGDKVETFAVKSMLKSSAAIQKLDLAAMREAVEFEEMVPQKVQSRLQYTNVYPNTDVIYDLDSNKVKESIILESYTDTLRGYRYRLDVGEMIPVLEESGQILFYDADRENVVMVMPAPYLMDANNCYNGDIQVQLEGSGSTYTLTYLLPRQWLAAEDRAWPVILDPIVTADLSPNNIKDRTVAEYKTYAYDWGMNEAGYDVNYGRERFYMKYEALPALTSSDVVVSAAIQMYKPANSGVSAPVEVHKVLGTWESTTITWANKPDYNTNVEDYAIVLGQQWYAWNITDIVRSWYAGQNTGMMFKVSDDVENGGTANWKQFYSADWGYYKPVLSIMFRNNNGLESYWDYTSSSAGRAGTGYVNNYTGNLVWTRDDIGFGGTRMPVSISHIYNLNDAVVPSDSNNSNDSGGNHFGLGSGWRTNYNQLLYQWSVDSSYFVWEDSDGTDHYFKADSSGVIKDEDGLELTLTTNGSGTETYCITDKNGNCSYFDAQGRLTRLSNNQATKSHIHITYLDSTSKRISTVTDGVGRVYVFTYTGGMLDRISYRGTGSTEISYVAFGYDGALLTAITDADHKTSTFGYTNSCLSYAQDIDGYRVTYTHTIPTASYQPYRVRSVSETDGDVSGGSLTFEYAHNQTIITDYNGNVEIMQFNDFGNTVSIQDDEGRAQFAQFARTGKDDTGGKAHQLKVASKLQNTVGNLLKDSSFELAAPWGTNSSAVTISRTTETAYRGNYSLKAVSSTENDSVGAFSNTFYVAPGETATLSAYVKNPDAPAFIGAHYYDGINFYTYPGPTLAVSDTWVRTEVTFKNTRGEAVWLCMYLFTPSPGTYYIDCVQAEKAQTASRYNLIENGDFQNGSYGWTYDSLTGTDGIVTTAAPAPAAQLDNSVLQLTGSPTSLKHVYQAVNISGNAGDTYVLSGWAKGDSVPLDKETNDERQFALAAFFFNTDGSVTKRVVRFNPDTDSNNSWQYVAGAVVADKPYSGISIDCQYDYNANTAYFDGVQLYKEEFGNSYTYDDKGNVISVVDLQKQNTSYEYDASNNLTKIIQNNRAKVTYTYDNNHNVKTATTQEGEVYTFEYDAYGNNTSVSIGSGSTKITTSATYTSDGNRLVSTTDATGKVTQYSYNENTNVLEWVQYPEDTQATRTSYTYDSMYRIARAACTTDTVLGLSTEYIYTDDLLTSIETPSSTYNFTYGEFDLRTGVSIGNRTLATYKYTEESVDDRKYDLDRLDYGNGDSIQYEYDDKGRVTKQTYEDGNAVEYWYDNSGALAKTYDWDSNITTVYYYDFADRLMKYEESGGWSRHSVGYEYDDINNLTKLVETVNGVEHTTSYTYDEDNRVTEVNTDGRTVTYTYDAYGRVSQQVTKNGSTTVLTEYFTYHAPTASTTTGQIATHRTVSSGYDITYTYTYDDNGNILSVSDGTNTTSYVYDSANQLIRENNQAGSFTHTWTYDSAGNIMARREYAYTTGELGTPTHTASYTYGDSEWGDLLTGYDGNTITSDQIGNMLSDGTWNYTWKCGRKLAGMSDGSNYYGCTYDANGMRVARSSGITNYTYVYNGSSLSQMTDDFNKLDFTYDANGRPTTVTYNGTLYYYVTNLQGDVVAILNNEGAQVVSYTYDAWGNILSVSGSMANTLGTSNPLRYRGYVYDVETGLYYVSSRYYDPEIGRWINADNQLSTGSDFTGLNLFAYCGNNPVNRFDPTGEAWIHWLAGAAVVAGFAALTVITCGGSLALAATSVGLVANGIAAATTATTVAAAGFIGSAVAYGTAVVTAACNSTSVNDFRDQGNWGTVGATALCGLAGGYSGYTMSKAQATQTVADDDTFLPDSFYSKHAPKQSTPNSSYTNYTYNNYTGKYEKSTAYYDFAGRQNIRIDWTNHGYSNHGNPHVHYTTYNSQYRDGFTIRWD